jgi:hypothetical protein
MDPSQRQERPTPLDLLIEPVRSANKYLEPQASPAEPHPPALYAAIQNTSLRTYFSIHPNANMPSLPLPENLGFEVDKDKWGRSVDYRDNNLTRERVNGYLLHKILEWESKKN